jgi:hypothetical protein
MHELDEAWNTYLMEADVEFQEALEARRQCIYDADIINGNARRANARVRETKLRYEERATCYAAWFRANHA